MGFESNEFREGRLCEKRPLIVDLSSKIGVSLLGRFVDCVTAAGCP